MKISIPASLALAIALAACEQDSQTLPFDPASEEATVRHLSASEGGTVTSPAGAAVLFPAGALRQATEVSVTPVALPAGLAASGSPVSRGFRVSPEGLELDEPARVELRIDPGVESARTWLASLVVITEEGVEEIGGTRLDLRARLAEAPFTRLGTLAMVIPDPAAVFLTQTGGAQASLSGAASELLPTGTDSVAVACGSLGARCDGLSVYFSENLTEKVSQAAAIYPRVAGALRIHGARASGAITLSSSVRLLLSSQATAENVELHGLLQPTEATIVSEDASAITLTNMLVRVGGGVGSDEGATEALRTVVIEKSGSRGFASFSRSFELRDESGQLENASVSITFPVQIHQ